MVRRKWRIKTPMLVPAQWQGSVEHFYHFFHGYFVPAVLWQERTQHRQFAVRDCGPMNPWFDLLAEDTELEYLPPGVMLQRVLSNRQEHTILRSWDDPTRFHRASLRRFATVVTQRVGGSLPQSAQGQPSITVLDRGASADFYLQSGSESYGSASLRRSVPTMDEVAEALTGIGNVTVADAAALTPTEQVRLFRGTDLLVAQHGAGLSNIVWLPDDASVVEIQPPLPPTIREIFRNLSAIRSVNYGTVSQHHDHAPVDVSQVTQTARALLSQPGAHVPTVTTRWPLRVLRQLPRRL